MPGSAWRSLMRLQVARFRFQIGFCSKGIVKPFVSRVARRLHPPNATHCTGQETCNLQPATCNLDSYGATGPIVGPLGWEVGNPFPIPVAASEQAACPQPLALVVWPVEASTVVS